MTPPKPSIIAGHAFCLLMAIWPTATTFRDGKPLNVAAGLLATAGILLLATPEWTRDTLARTHAATTEGGLRFTTDRSQRALLLTAQLFLAASLLLIGYLQYQGQICWIPASGHYGRHGRMIATVMPVALPIAGLLSLPWAWLAADKLASLDEPSHVEVQPAGVELVYSEDKRRFLRWEDIAGLPGGFRTNRGLWVSKLRFTLTDGKAVEAPLVALSDNSVAVNELLGFYLAHPALRGELTTGAALNRYRRRDYRVPARPAGDAA